MKKVKVLSVSVIMALSLIFGVITISTVTAEQGGSDPCCRNGYKTWSDPGIFGGGTNFVACRCHGYKGKDMDACGYSGSNSATHFGLLVPGISEYQCHLFRF